MPYDWRTRKPEAEGRCICVAHSIREKDLVEKLSLYPNLSFSKK